MTIYLVARASDTWDEDDFQPLYEAGYFDTEQDAVDWINSTDYVQGLYDEYVAELNEMNAERAERHAQKVEKYKVLVKAGYREYESEPGEFHPYPMESFEDFSDDYQFKVVPVERAS